MARVFDIVEHPNVGKEELSYREPQSGSGDFRIGSQLIVRDNQAAVFVRGGEALDAFGAGTHTLTTANIPLLVGLIGKAFSGETPFKAEAYFINTADMPQVGWGTTQPLALETPGKSLCTSCFEPKPPHQVCPHCGSYKGREVIRVEELD